MNPNLNDLFYDDLLTVYFSDCLLDNFSILEYLKEIMKNNVTGQVIFDNNNKIMQYPEIKIIFTNSKYCKYWSNFLNPIMQAQQLVQIFRVKNTKINCKLIAKIFSDDVLYPKYSDIKFFKAFYDHVASFISDNYIYILVTCYWTCNNADTLIEILKLIFLDSDSNKQILLENSSSSIFLTGWIRYFLQKKDVENLTKLLVYLRLGFKHYNWKFYLCDREIKRFLKYLCDKIASEVHFYSVVDSKLTLSIIKFYKNVYNLSDTFIDDLERKLNKQCES